MVELVNLSQEIVLVQQASKVQDVIFIAMKDGMEKIVHKSAPVSMEVDVITLLASVTVLLDGRVICVVQNAQMVNMDIIVPKRALTV